MVSLSKTCEKVERFADMCTVIQELVKMLLLQKKEFSMEERTLAGVAFKNAVGQLRGAWRMVWTDDVFVEAAAGYREHVREQLTTFCQASLELFFAVAQQPGLSTENHVFALKLQADFNRYIREVDPDNNDAAEAASKLYEQATTLAESLEATDPLRLGVALNYAVCCHEVLKDTKQACQLVKAAFNQAIAKLDEIEDDQYKDSTLLMQLLRDNLTLWTADTT